MESATVIIPTMMFEHEPEKVTCGNCYETVMATTIAENESCAWVAVLIACLLYCCFFWIPLVMDFCKDMMHTCPACGDIPRRYKK